MDDELSGVGSLLVELQLYEFQGISIWLGNSRSNSEEVSRTVCVNDENTYMRDYVFQDGALAELHFDQIRLEYS